MKRISEMENSVKKNWCLRTNVKRKFLNEHYMELKPDFDEKLYNLFEQQKNRSKHIKGRKIQSIYLNRLLSSVYTESYESMLGMSGPTLYLDEKRSQVYWIPECIYETIDKDMVEAEKILRRKFICIQEFELFYIKRKLLDDDWKLLKKVFVTLSKQSMNLIMNSSLKLDDEFLLFCGNYMDNLKILLQARVKN